MTTRDPKAAEPRAQGEVKAPAPGTPGAGGDDACRCKATAVMTPRQLLGLMVRDLAFWKKTKKG